MALLNKSKHPRRSQGKQPKNDAVSHEAMLAGMASVAVVSAIPSSENGHNEWLTVSSPISEGSHGEVLFSSTSEDNGPDGIYAGRESNVVSPTPDTQAVLPELEVVPAVQSVNELSSLSAPTFDQIAIMDNLHVTLATSASQPGTLGLSQHQFSQEEQVIETHIEPQVMQEEAECMLAEESTQTSHESGDAPVADFNDTGDDEDDGPEYMPSEDYPF